MKALLILITALSLSAMAQADRVYSVGVESFPYYPYSETRGDSFGGYARDILDAFAKVKGYKLEYYPMPYLRIFDNFINNELDLQYPDNEYWLEELKTGHNIYYSQPAVQYTDGVHVLAENKDKGIASIESLGTLIGFSPIQYFPLEKKGQLKIHYSATVSGLIEQTHLGRIDGVYLNVDVIKHHERNKSDRLVFDDTLPHINSGFSLSSIHYPEVILDFNDFLKENPKLVNSIKQKYDLK